MFHKLLIAYFAAFFLVWSLGLDQLYFVFICIVGFFAFLSAEKHELGPEAIIFAIFVFVTFFSVFQISTADRYITYFRNEGVYIAMLFIVVSASFASAREGDTTDKLYFALLLFSMQCTVVGFMASQGFSIAFKSLTAHVLPDVGSKYLNSMINKDTVQAEALWFSKGFIRPRGLMMYPNTMAGILASSMAIKAYFVHKFWRDGFKILAVLCLGAIYLDIFSIYASLSRSTWISLAFALIVFPFIFKTNLLSKLIPALVGVFVMIMVFFTGLSDGIQTRLFEKTHSNESRGLNYTLIWEETTSTIDKFLFGHGTQIDHWQLGIPLGSHSTYLGIFFKFGVIGFIFLVLFLFILYRRSVFLTKSAKLLNANDGGHIRPYFLCFALLIPVVQMIFIEVDVDLSYALYFAALVFLVSQEIHVVDTRLGSLRIAREV